MPTVAPPPAQAQQTPPDPSATPAPARVDQGLVRQLGQEAGGTVDIAYHQETGKVRFVGTRPGQPIARSARVAATASGEEAARAFMGSYGPLFGVQDQARELTVKREKAVGSGRSVVRLAQQYNGIPVFAGEVVVHVDRTRNVQAATGELLPDIAVDTTPTVSPNDARTTAVQLVSFTHEVDAADLVANEPTLWIYNQVLVGDPGPRLTQLVWRLEVRSAQLAPIRELVLIDAHSGAVALRFNQVHTAKNRRTHDMNGVTSPLPGTLRCDEANPACTGGDTDEVNAHRYAGETYDFYQSRHGRDGIDGAGGTLISSVHYSVSYQNAFWNGAQMVYGDGYAVDDVVGHELTHGVTDYESELMYFRQSGAINESFSDVWGEFIDLVNSSGNDAAGVRWQLAEDIPGGPIRNMANPPLHNDPDKMTSSLYHANASDSGGVHINSGVNNKAASLLVDGGTFNGKTITALGIDKVAKIYYEVQTNLMTPGSDYADLYTAMQQACSTLTGTAGITAADCQSVVNAVQAVEMNLRPTVAGAVPAVAPMCAAGQAPVNVFFDDLENTASGNWAASNLFSNNQRWFYPQLPQL